MWFSKSRSTSNDERGAWKGLMREDGVHNDAVFQRTFDVSVIL